MGQARPIHLFFDVGSCADECETPDQYADTILRPQRAPGCQNRQQGGTDQDAPAIHAGSGAVSTGAGSASSRVAALNKAAITASAMLVYHTAS
jgi:hypothetical protein